MNQVFCTRHQCGAFTENTDIYNEHISKHTDCVWEEYDPVKHIPEYDKAKIENKTTKPKPQKKQTVSKTKGYIEDIYVESILLDGKPMFICLDAKTNQLSTISRIETDNAIYRPLDKNECGYIPYSYTVGELESLFDSRYSREAILEDIKYHIDRFIVAPERDKTLILGDIFLTYCQESIGTVHFPFFVGETESGKSTSLHLGRYLNYRCWYEEDIQYADIYNFLGTDEEGAGTICEDEAQDLWKSREKIKTYKNSYAKGSTKARVLIDMRGKKQVYYKTFCPKWFAGESIPSDKGFRERLVVVYMMEGQPQGNIKKPTKDEVTQLCQLRNRLLIYKLQNLGKEFERFDSGLKQRTQELFEDFLSIGYGTKFFEQFKEVVDFYSKQRQESIKDSLEAKIFGIALGILDKNLKLAFTELWDCITQSNTELPGTLDSSGSKTFHPEGYGTKITPYSLAQILEFKFQAKKQPTNQTNENGAKTKVTYYQFKREVVCNLAKKYGVELPSSLNLGQLGHLGQLDEDQGDQHDQVYQGDITQ